MARLLRVELSSNAVDLEPGTAASLTVRIVNTSQIVERYAITVVGPAERWSTVTPAELPLMPDDEGTAEVTMTAPAEHAPPAGTAVVGIKVSSTRTGASWVEELEVHVSSVARVTLALAPELRRTSGTANYEAVIDNQGNVPLALELRGEDQERAAHFQFAPPSLEVLPGEEPARVRVRVTVPRRWTGPEVTRMLTVHALGAPEPLQASATLVQRSRLSSGLLRGIGGAAAAAVIVGAILIPKLLGGDEPANGSATTVGPVTTAGPATTAGSATSQATPTTDEPPSTGGGQDTTTSTTRPLGPPVVIRFDTRPGGGTLTQDLRLVGDEYTPRGIRVRGVPGSCPAGPQAGIRLQSNDVDVPYLTTMDPTDTSLCNDSQIEIEFTQPVRSVTLVFTGVNGVYTMDLFDPSGQPKDSVSGQAVPGGAPAEVSSPPDSGDIGRLRFGRQGSLTAITEIRYQR